jgi:hypothetical protein
MNSSTSLREGGLNLNDQKSLLKIGKGFAELLSYGETLPLRHRLKEIESTV